MSLQLVLSVLGLVFMAAMVFAVKPGLLRRLCAQADMGGFIAYVGLFFILLSLPVLIHYAGVLYPLDLLVLPTASVIFALGVTYLLFPGEVAAFIRELTKLKGDLFIRLVALTVVVYGLMLLNTAFQQ